MMIPSEKTLRDCLKRNELLVYFFYIDIGSIIYVGFVVVVVVVVSFLIWGLMLIIIQCFFFFFLNSNLLI